MQQHFPRIDDRRSHDAQRFSYHLFLPPITMSSNTVDLTLSQRTRRAALGALAAAFVSLASVSCTSGDDDSGQFNGAGSGGSGGGGGELAASGTLTLSGADTPAVGTEFVVGDGAREIEGTLPSGYLFVDAPKMFTAAEYAAADFNPALDIVGFDPQNTTLFAVIVDEAGSVLGVSMGFRLDGIDYGYTCAGVAGAPGQPCGDVVFDQDAGQFLFNGVILEPNQSAGSTDLLTLDGVISLSL